jgi:hypothetical protein
MHVIATEHSLTDYSDLHCILGGTAPRRIIASKVTGPIAILNWKETTLLGYFIVTVYTASAASPLFRTTTYSPQVGVSEAGKILIDVTLFWMATEKGNSAYQIEPKYLC